MDRIEISLPLGGFDHLEYYRSVRTTHIYFGALGPGLSALEPVCLVVARCARCPTLNSEVAPCYITPALGRGRRSQELASYSKRKI